ncbi:MAG: DUF4157 domain-containing protein [Dehalococcoidia bacterium]
MKAKSHTHTRDYQVRSVAHQNANARASRRSKSGSTEHDSNDLADNRPEAITQRRLQNIADTSPQTVAQLQQMERLSGKPAQLQGPMEDEELLQGKFKPAQLQSLEEDEELQMKSTGSPVQRQGPMEDEELLQGKFKPAQLQSLEEDEELQMKSTGSPIQLQSPMEDEELLQGKFKPAQLQSLEEDEELQMKSTGSPAQLQGPMDEEELLQGKFPQHHSVTQLKDSSDPPKNRTGLPDSLKAGIESLSGLAMDDVKVHYNSAKPASLQALAYTQGTDIHVGPGQEQHLAHEAWHVAQQKQGRVRPTVQVENTVVNDDTSLEREADVMGAKAKRLDALPVFQAKGMANEVGSRACYQLMWWTWINGQWYPDSETTNPVPGHNGNNNYERYDDGSDNNNNDEDVCPFGEEDILEKRGMTEVDAKELADYHGMEDVSSDKWICPDDKPHTPKGKLYQKGNRYYGADNTGHVGFCFKIWKKSGKGKWSLEYLGNITHNLKTQINRG